MKVRHPYRLGAAVPFLAVCLSFASIAGADGNDSTPVGNAAEEFPPLPTPRTPSPGIEFYRIQIAGSGPGRPMELNLYLPTGKHQPKSLPCVLIAPAGSGQHGMTIGDGDRAEHLPYVQAGFAVMAYELSGAMTGPSKDTYTYGDMKDPVTRFMEADGGLINGRTAIDYVLKKVPAIDPTQLYACGHSSAATVALNLARGDARIRACCAYAPPTDVEKWWNDPKMEKFVPGFRSFSTKKSPLRHIAEFNCPVYLFHADDDSMVALSDNQVFVQSMQAAGKKITFERVAAGEHYQSMIDHGIPGGIKFMKALGAKPMPPATAPAERH